MAQGPTDVKDKTVQYPNTLKFIENAMLAFLQATFYFNQQGTFRYSENDAETEIAIEGQRTDNLKNMDTRPKITVARGPVNIQMAGINNFVGSQNLTPYQQKFAHIRDGSVGISCFSRNELEADQIAEMVVDRIDSMRNVLQRFGFLQIQTAHIGQRALVKSDSKDELFVVPILLRVKVTKNYSSAITDPVKLRAFIFEYYIEPLGLVIRPEQS